MIRFLPEKLKGRYHGFTMDEFSDAQRQTLQRYVTSTTSNIFALMNLPEVIKGALFSRYSRSTLGLRALLMKEFIQNEETNFDAIVGGKEVDAEDQKFAIQKAQNFYDRILDGYGDDSIAELGGAHLAIENVSMIAAKLIEDSRIGGSPLEKSTRYIYFDQKVNGDYLFFREPVLMTSAWRTLYVETCNFLFETYSALIPPLTAIFEEKFPYDPETPKSAYTAALRAKVLDCLRGILPASTMTNMGMFGNGRFFEQLIHRLRCSPLGELQDIADKSYTELAKVIPSFISRADRDHRHHQSYEAFRESMNNEIEMAAAEHEVKVPSSAKEPGVRLIYADKDGPSRVAAALLWARMDHPLQALQQYTASLSDEELAKILETGCSQRENRRQKSPRALEHATFTFEIVGDFGMYRDLHRHRMLTQERQFLSCDYGYWVPSEIVGTDLEGPYIEAMERAKKAYDSIATDFPEEGQYIVPMAYNVRWYFHVNLRSLQWLCELRSAAAGHPTYRFVAQEMAKQVCAAFPAFERYFAFVDYDGYTMGRMSQEIRRATKKEAAV